MIPSVTLALVVSNVAVFGIMVYVAGIGSLLSGDHDFIGMFAVVPACLSGYENCDAEHVIIRPFTYMFVHIGIVHLLFNMFALWSFGRLVEYDMGKARFLAIYVAAGIGGIVAMAIYDPTSPVAVGGASGAVSGLLGAAIVLFPPTRRFGIFWLVAFNVVPIIFPSFSFGNIAYIVHIGGAVLGIVIGIGVLVYRRRKYSE